MGYAFSLHLDASTASDTLVALHAARTPQWVGALSVVYETVEDLEHVATAGPVAARAAMAGNAQMPSRVRDRLLHDPDPEVRRYLAQNTATSLRILRALATDADPRVRSAVVRQKKVSSDILAALSRDADPAVRAMVAQSGSKADAVFLSHDPDPEVRHRVGQFCRDPETLVRLSHDPEAHVRLGVAQSWYLPASVAATLLDSLAVDADPEVRVAVARHAQTPLETLAVLAHDADPAVRRTLAVYGRLDAVLLQTLARDADGAVRLAIVNR